MINKIALKAALAARMRSLREREYVSEAQTPNENPYEIHMKRKRKHKQMSAGYAVLVHKGIPPDVARDIVMKSVNKNLYMPPRQSEPGLDNPNQIYRRHQAVINELSNRLRRIK